VINKNTGEIAEVPRSQTASVHLPISSSQRSLFVLNSSRIMAVHRLWFPLSLAFDQRAVTGDEAIRFLAAVIEDVEQRK
jgi:pyruvate/2-oxoglutarate dehydrogenase complex dihydrolipoamide acyltransferase (E2) component